MHIALTLAVLLSLTAPPKSETPKKTVALFNMPRVEQPKFEYDRGQESRYFVCPKDGALLRVPSSAPGKTFKCPLDGTEMKAGTGRDGRFFLIER